MRTPAPVVDVFVGSIPGRRVRGWSTRNAWTAAACVLAIAGFAHAQSLESRVQGAIEKAKLAGAHIGVSVVDVETGKQLVDIDRGGKEPGFMPASNLKLITSGVATLVLGPDYEFRTELVLSGDKLVVQGTGDPALGDPELLGHMHISVDAMAGKLVDSVKSSGATGIREVLLNDRVFDREYVHPDWPKEQLNRAYCAEVCGINFHANVLNVFVSPGAGVGSEASARTQPGGSWIAIKRLAKTVKEGSTEVWLERDKDPYSFRLHGTVRNAPDVPVQVTVDEPSVMFGRVLAEGLGKAGLGAQGAMPTVRLIGTDEAAPEGGTIAASVRTPLSVVLERCNVDSDNLYAESLLKAAGHKQTGQPGSWANGTAVARSQIKDALGSEMAAKLIMADGSGLSRNNRVTPEMLTRWLAYMAGSPGGDMYVRSMALAGEEGTLKKRFKGSKLKNEVRAKSGYIRQVRSLSGYVIDPSTNKRMAFSVIVNDVPSGGDQRAKELHEDVVEIVDDYLAQVTGRTEPAKTTTKSKSKSRSTASADR